MPLFSDSLPPWPLEPMDTNQLVKLIEAALIHFTDCHSSYEATYLRQLHVIVDCHQLVLTALGEHRCNFPFSANDLKQPVLIQALAFRIANMINTLADKIRLVDDPWYAPNFTEAVTAILSSKICYLGDLSVAQDLLNKILPTRRGGRDEIF